MNLEEGNPMWRRIANETHETVSQITQTAMNAMGPQNNGTIPDIAYVGCMAALAALMNTGAVLAKSPQWVKDKASDSFTKSDAHRLCSEVMTSETVTFAALVSAYTLYNLDHNGNLDTRFGPPTLWRALEAWTKLFPGLKADNYFDPNMLAAARKAGLEVEKPFADFLQSRITHKDSPGTLN